MTQPFYLFSLDLFQAVKHGKIESHDSLGKTGEPIDCGSQALKILNVQ